MAPKVLPVDVADLARLGILFEEHRPKLLAMVRRRSDQRLAARRDPEDIVNDAFLKAQSGWAEFCRKPGKPYAWLYTIVLNCLYDDHDFHSRGRRSRRAEVAFPDQSSMQLAAGLISPVTSPSSAAAREEYLANLRKRMAQAMELLKPDDREILCMRFCDELATEEIAEVLAIAPAACRQRLTRARLRFMDLWKELFGREGLET
jgi:RNA polymerase sigma-70 factor (ECF subfamily)